MRALVYFFYTFTYSLIYGLLLILKPILNSKTQKWIELRQNFTFHNIPIKHNAVRIWIHASSGEIEYAKSLIREIKKQQSESQIFVSYSSLSAPKLFKNIESEVDYFFPLNWDISSQNKNLIQKIQPQILIFSRTDFWFNLIKCCEKEKIPLATISIFPTLSLMNIIWLKLILKNFKFISAATEDVAEQIKVLLPQVDIEYIPDTRFDQAFHRLSQPSKLHISTTKNIITFGSTWPQDETVLLSAVDPILKSNTSIIWAPHEITHVEQLELQIKTLFPNLKIIQLSHFYDKSITNDFDILLIDEIGYLADAYRFSKIAFLGGSFVKKVHSVMEPLCAQNIVCLGPYHHNNPEALQFKKMNLVREFHNADEFVNILKEVGLNPELQTRLQTEVSKMQGGTSRNYKKIFEIISILHKGQKSL